MSSYRLHFLNDHMSTQSVAVFDSADDVTAIAEAIRQAEGCPIEVWHQARLVKRFGRSARVG